MNSGWIPSKVFFNKIVLIALYCSKAAPTVFSFLFFRTGGEQLRTSYRLHEERTFWNSADSEKEEKRKEEEFSERHGKKWVQVKPFSLGKLPPPSQLTPSPPCHEVQDHYCLHLHHHQLHLHHATPSRSERPTQSDKMGEELWFIVLNYSYYPQTTSGRPWPPSPSPTSSRSLQMLNFCQIFKFFAVLLLHCYEWLPNSFTISLNFAAFSYLWQTLSSGSATNWSRSGPTGSP